MREDLLTVKQFASAAGITQQAVYQRLNKSLQDYVVVLNDKKYLKLEALSLFDGAKQKQAEVNQVEQDLINVDQELIKTLQTTISILQGQLETKDAQIAELNARLKDALELNKGQVLLSVSDRQQLPETTPERDDQKKRTIWDRFRKQK